MFIDRASRLASTAILVSLLVLGCSRPGGETGFVVEEHGFGICYPSTWARQEGGVAPQDQYQVTFASSGAAIRIAVSNRPIPDRTPKILRDKGWTESSVTVDGISALSYIRPTAAARDEPVKLVSFSLNGSWYEVSLVCADAREATKHVSTFDKLVASWRWLKTANVVPPQTSPTSTTLFPEPRETASLTLTHRALVPVTLTETGTLSHFEEAMAAKVALDWAPVSRAPAGIEVVQSLKDGGARGTWWQPSILWVGDQAFTGDQVVESWRHLAIKAVTVPGLVHMVEAATRVELVARDYPKLPSAVLSQEQVRTLKQCFSQATGIENADEEYAVPPISDPPGYEIRMQLGGAVYSAKLMGKKSGVMLADLWNGEPKVFFSTPNIEAWARQTLPIPAYPPDSLESLYRFSSVPGKITAPDGAATLYDVRRVVKIMLDAFPPGDLRRPSAGPTGESPYTLKLFSPEGEEADIPVWNDWFSFAGKSYYYRDFRRILASMVSPN